jgi:threonine aldolase
VASGTMGNLVSILAHCERGDEVILGDQSHTFFHEQGGMSALGSVHPHTVPNLPDGTMDIEQIQAAIRADNIHFPRTRLIAIENTHNRCNGNPITTDYMRAVGRIAHDRGLKVHVDGARLFNAAISLGVEAGALAAEADSVTFCLSKGLAAPVGSVVCGPSEFILKARRARKVLGGGMRQAGVLAAAGILALDEMVERLAEDHANARTLAEGLAELKGLEINPEDIRTNIVYFQIARENPTPQRLAEGLRALGVRILPTGPRQLRAVTNYHVTAKDIAFALDEFREVLNGK